jgi:hypothetical protein
MLVGVLIFSPPVRIEAGHFFTQPSGWIGRIDAKYRAPIVVIAIRDIGFVGSLLNLFAVAAKMRESGWKAVRKGELVF